MSEVILEIDGKRWEDWQSVSIKRSLETMAAQFSLSLTDRWAADTAPRSIRPHQSCRVLIGDELIISGAIDEALPRYDASETGVDVSGRSLTGQLADCAAVLKGGELAGQSLAKVAQRLCAPHGVIVADATDGGAAFARVQIEPGELIAEVLERLARQRGVFLTDNAEGNLVITRRSDRQGGPVTFGKNVLTCKGRLSGTDQFSSYEIKGQTEGGDFLSPKASASSAGRAEDLSVPRHRPMVILSETQGDDAALRQRAVFEAALRRGRARQWVYEVDSWFDGDDGSLWRPNTIVPVTDPFMGLDGLLLLVAVELVIDDQGRRASLTVAPPEGYDLLAIPEKKAEATGLW